MADDRAGWCGTGCDRNINLHNNKDGRCGPCISKHIPALAGQSAICQGCGHAFRDHGGAACQRCSLCAGFVRFGENTPTSSPEPVRAPPLNPAPPDGAPVPSDEVFTVALAESTKAAAVSAQALKEPLPRHSIAKALPLDHVCFGGRCMGVQRAPNTWTGCSNEISHSVADGGTLSYVCKVHAFPEGTAPAPAPVLPGGPPALLDGLCYGCRIRLRVDNSKGVCGDCYKGSRLATPERRGTWQAGQPYPPEIEQWLLRRRQVEGQVATNLKINDGVKFQVPPPKPAPPPAPTPPPLPKPVLPERAGGVLVTPQLRANPPPDVVLATLMEWSELMAKTAGSPSVRRLALDLQASAYRLKIEVETADQQKPKKT